MGSVWSSNKSYFRLFGQNAIQTWRKSDLTLSDSHLQRWFGAILHRPVRSPDEQEHPQDVHAPDQLLPEQAQRDVQTHGDGLRWQQENRQQRHQNPRGDGVSERHSESSMCSTKCVMSVPSLQMTQGPVSEKKACKYRHSQICKGSESGPHAKWPSRFVSLPNPLINVSRNW